MKNKKVFIIVSLIGVAVIFFIAGYFWGKENCKIESLLSINQWDVKKFSSENDDNIIYESDNSGGIVDSKTDGWNKLLSEISIVGFKRNKTEGSTAHLYYKIEMKNGDIYHIEWLGCMNQVDITYPNGEIKEFYAYHQ